MERIFKNTFFKGINSDLSKELVEDGSYLMAENLTLTGDGKFLALENLKGTTAVAEVTASFTGDVLGAFACKFSISSNIVEALVVFTATSGGNFKIYAVDLDNQVTYELYEEAYTSEFEQSNPVVDAVVYPENGVDIVYYTDGYNEIRKFRCEIPSPYSANFLTKEQISVQRRAALAKVSPMVNTGGDLLTGSYQFSVRLYNQTSKTYSRWTIPTIAYNVSKSQSGDFSIGYYGINSNKKIDLDVQVPENEIGNWTHFQIAVIENTGSTEQIVASLQKLTTIGSPSLGSGYATVSYEYRSNIKIGEVQLADIVVDLAAIKNIKTLQVKNNRLFVANAELVDLDYDNGDPTLVSGATITSAGDPSDDNWASDKSHFRDEVYRYYITYFDERYNFSRPKVLDTSIVAGNTCSAPLDMRFPSRKVQGYTLLNTSSEPLKAGMYIVVNNHPSWARGFYIFRAKRKKRIKFQTPLIPSCLIEGLGATGRFPSSVQELNSDSSGTETREYTTASPMNPVGTHIPKNLFFPVRRDYIAIDQDITTAGQRTQKGEIIIEDPDVETTSNTLFFAFPPNIYNTGINYQFSVGDSYETVDYAFTRLGYNSYQTNSFETNVGNFIQTSVAGTFRALFYDDYYYNPSSNRSAPVGPVSSGTLEGYADIDAYGEGTQLSGLSVCEFSRLEAQNSYRYNTKPNNQRMGVFKVKAPKTDAASYSITTNSGASVSASLYETSRATMTNTFSPSKIALGASDRVNIIETVNIVNDLDDFRYGDAEDLHDMVFTGACHVFNDSELADVQTDGDRQITLNVYGGDCFVSAHYFKLTDNHYGVMNVEKNGGGALSTNLNIARIWSAFFYNRFFGATTTPEIICQMPVPYKNVSQVLILYLESEVNGEVTGLKPYPTNTVSGKLSLNSSMPEQSLKIAFPYQYHVGYSKEANQKVLIPFNENENVVTKFKARGYYSDQKVYGTDIDGFDIIRAASSFDLEETYGGITKLALAGDNLYALQEGATVFLPVDADNISTTDGDTLSIRSGEVIGLPTYISRQYGCQHTAAAKITDRSVFFPDNNNQCVIKLEEGISLISEKGAIGLFNTLFSNDLTDIRGLWDNNRKQYWVYTPTKCYVWDERLQLWVSNLQFEDRLKGGVFTDNRLYLVGDTGDLDVYTMYTGDYNDLMGAVVPNVEFSVSPDFDVPKTFDNVVIYSSAILDTVDMRTESDSGLNQNVLGMIIANNREGNYRIPVLRDGSNGRLRGLRAIAKFYWPASGKVSLSQVVTKYRPSARMI